MARPGEGVSWRASLRRSSSDGLYLTIGGSTARIREAPRAGYAVTWIRRPPDLWPRDQAGTSACRLQCYKASGETLPDGRYLARISPWATAEEDGGPSSRPCLVARSEAVRRAGRVDRERGRVSLVHDSHRADERLSGSPLEPPVLLLDARLFSTTGRSSPRSRRDPRRRDDRAVLGPTRAYLRVACHGERACVTSTTAASDERSPPTPARPRILPLKPRARR